MEGLPFSRCIKVIAPQLRKERFWEIDECLIEDLGNAFLMDKTYLALDLVCEKIKCPTGEGQPAGQQQIKGLFQQELHFTG